MKYQTLKDAGYRYLFYSNGEHHLVHEATGTIEIFGSNKYHSGWALIYKNTHLEFLRSVEFVKRGVK